MYNRRSVYHCGAYTEFCGNEWFDKHLLRNLLKTKDESQLFLIGSVENEVIIDMERVGGFGVSSG